MGHHHSFFVPPLNPTRHQNPNDQINSIPASVLPENIACNGLQSHGENLTVCEVVDALRPSARAETFETMPAWQDSESDQAVGRMFWWHSLHFLSISNITYATPASIHVNRQRIRDQQHMTAAPGYASSLSHHALPSYANAVMPGFPWGAWQVSLWKSLENQKIKVTSSCVGLWILCQLWQHIETGKQ